MTSRWRDVTAGLCVAGLLLPEAVAYAGLAHVPVLHALIATLTGLAIYAAFGGSRFAVVAPTSSTATLSAAAVVAIPGPLSDAAAVDAVTANQAFLALVLLAGGALMLLALARQGQLSAFVSRPVLRGFAFALAITIVIKQLPDALGLQLPPGAAADPFRMMWFAITHTSAWHGPSVLTALTAGALIAGLKRWPQIPGSMLVIATAIAFCWAWDLPSAGVRVVGLVPNAPFNWGFPQLPASEWFRMAELAVGLVVLIFAESWGSMRTLALSHGDNLDANRELMVLGVCNVCAALLQGMAVGAGFSASSANAAAGAVSRWAGVVALAVVTGAVLIALPALAWLPRPVLAVAVISALWHALSARPLLAAWGMNRDRLLIVCAVAAVLLLGVLHGMLTAVALSLVAALRRFSQPIVHELGELASTRNFVVIEHGGASAPGLMILRPEEPLFFASAERVTAEVMRRVMQRTADAHVAVPLTTVVLSLEESADLDSTAVECLLELRQRLAGHGQQLLLARVKEPVRSLLASVDPDGLGHPQRMFWSVADGVSAGRSTPSG